MFNTAANTEIFENYFPDPVERGRFISVTADVISIIYSHLSVTVWKSLNYAKTMISYSCFFIHFLYSITLKRTQSFEAMKKIKASLWELPCPTEKKCIKFRSFLSWLCCYSIDSYYGINSLYGWLLKLKPNLIFKKLWLTKVSLCWACMLKDVYSAFDFCLIIILWKPSCSRSRR